MLLEQDFAMILLDVRMPGLDGFETAQLIKERTRTRDIPIVFLTAARDEMSQITRGYGVGAVDYVLKPFDPDLLRSKVSVFAELEASRRALKRSEALLSGAFEAAPIGKTVLDAEGRIVRSNPAFARLVGREPGELHGVAVVDLCELDDRPAMSAALEQIARAATLGARRHRAAEPRPAAAVERRRRGVGRARGLGDRVDRVRGAPPAGAVGRSDRAPPGRAGPSRPAARTGSAHAGGVRRRTSVEAPGPDDGTRGARARRDPAAAGHAAGRAVRGRGGGGADFRRARPAARRAGRRRADPHASRASRQEPRTTGGARCRW